MSDTGKPVRSSYKNVFEVKCGKNLAQILRAFPQAKVTTLISAKDEDAWRVEIERYEKPVDLF